MGKKLSYRVNNWKDYNRSLVYRGNFTMWVSEEAIVAWNEVEASSKPGRTPTYGALAIEIALMLRQIFRLPLRQTQGLLEGFFFMMGLHHLSAPCYITLSRRARDLEIDLGHLKKASPLNLVIDATGLKVYGEGEWKIRTHGKDKRRTWPKLHLGMDQDTHEIVALSLTPSNVHDSKQTQELLSQCLNPG